MSLVSMPLTGNPARDQFFDYVLDVVNPNPPTILCGDFNTVFNRGLDQSGSDVNDSSRENTPSLIQLCGHLACSESI